MTLLSDLGYGVTLSVLIGVIPLLCTCTVYRLGACSPSYLSTVLLTLVITLPFLTMTIRSDLGYGVTLYVPHVYAVLLCTHLTGTFSPPLLLTTYYLLLCTHLTGTFSPPLLLTTYYLLLYTHSTGTFSPPLLLTTYYLLLCTHRTGTFSPPSPSSPSSSPSLCSGSPAAHRWRSR